MLGPLVGYGFLLALHSNYGSMLYHFQEKARYWSKIAFFSYPIAFPSECCDAFGMKKLEWCGQPMVKKVPGYV